MKMSQLVFTQLASVRFEILLNEFDKAMKFNEMKILFGTDLLEKMKFFFVFVQLLMVVAVVERGQFQVDVAEKRGVEHEGTKSSERENEPERRFDLSRQLKIFSQMLVKFFQNASMFRQIRLKRRTNDRTTMVDAVSPSLDISIFPPDRIVRERLDRPRRSFGSTDSFVRRSNSTNRRSTFELLRRIRRRN